MGQRELPPGISELLDTGAREYSPEDSGAPSLDLLRYYAAAWEVTARVEAVKATLRLSLLMPKEARTLGVAPASGENAVILPLGEFFEIWRARAFVRYLVGSASSLRKLHEDEFE